MSIGLCGVPIAMQIYCVDPLPATKLPTQICMLTDFLFYVFPNRTFVRQTCSWVLLWWMLQVSVLHDIDMSRHLFHFYFTVLSSVLILWLDCFTVILKQIDVQNVANASQKSYTNARKELNEELPCCIYIA